MTCLKTWLLLLLLILNPVVASEDHETPIVPNSGIGQRKPGDNKSDAGREGCGVAAKDLSSFANGDSYNFRSLVTFLSDDTCQVAGGSIAQAALADKIQFNRFPFHLDVVGNNFSKLTLDGVRRIDLNLAQTVPGILRENNLSSRELYPIIGQLAILSPNAARSALSYVIQQELMAGSDLLDKSKTSKDVIANDIAKQTLRLGAGEERIFAQLADDIQDRAVSAEADSLSRIFKALATAASVESALVPTLNASSSALNRGIERSVASYESDQKQNMVKSVFEMIDALAQKDLNANQKFDSSAGELNAAMVALLSNTNVRKKFWKKVWRDVLRVLAHSTSQTALAEALAHSFTANLVYLPKEDQEVILEAGKNYKVIAQAIQWNFLESIRYSHDDLHEGHLEVAVYNARRKQYFEPLASRIMNWDGNQIEGEWLREMLSRGLIKDEDIEKKFPRLVLGLLERQRTAAKALSREEGIDLAMISMFQNFDVLWTLSTVQVPALSNWLEKYDSE